jgi:hypothetical protein
MSEGEKKETSQELWKSAAGQWESARLAWMKASSSQVPKDRDFAMAYEAYARSLECQARAKQS